MLPFPARLRHLPLLGALALGIAAAAAPAAGESSASASAAASDAAPPAASASAASPPKPPVVRGADIPTERSKGPKPKEWSDAREISPNDGSSRCVLKLLREWLRVECTNEYAGGLVAGSTKDVHVWAAGQLFAWDPVAERMTSSSLVFELPIERGQSRILSIVGIEAVGDYGGMIPSEGAYLHVTWREGAPDPVLVFTWRP